MCVYSYTNEMLDIHSHNTYNNDKMSNILFNKIKNKEYNINNKKDYYFLHILMLIINFFYILNIIL